MVYNKYSSVGVAEKVRRNGMMQKKKKTEQNYTLRTKNKCTTENKNRDMSDQFCLYCPLSSPYPPPFINERRQRNENEYLPFRPKIGYTLLYAKLLPKDIRCMHAAHKLASETLVINRRVP